MYFRYYSKYDSTNETIYIFWAADLDAAWEYLSEYKGLSVNTLRELYIIEYTKGS